MGVVLTKPTKQVAVMAQSQLQTCSKAKLPKVLTDIYQDKINIALWQRSFSDDMAAAITEFVAGNPRFSKSMTVSADSVYQLLDEATDGSAPESLLADITELVDMFCCLFELNQVGLRIAVIEGVMCPRFHVDKVPCRLVTTYHGVATEWLPNHAVDRSKLGHGSNGLADAESGLYGADCQIEQLSYGDVALLKGQSWLGNEDTALVHRSPINTAGGARLLMTLDFA
ncbi:DUF1826 domain-containing protein [Shewanella waksmanii]|uniref:DUF1826 domain-containing protein n=1 Tax=Shewanella waksmanii TaxID=213783 RepID=UPI0037365E83